MKLYKHICNISLVPGRDQEQALDRYNMNEENTTAEDFDVLIPHEDFIKIFRLARLLNTLDQYDYNAIQVIVGAYCKHLGYELDSKDLWDGILVWVERLDDADDEDIEDWLN